MNVSAIIRGAQVAKFLRVRDCSTSPMRSPGHRVINGAAELRLDRLVHLLKIEGSSGSRRSGAHGPSWARVVLIRFEHGFVALEWKPRRMLETVDSELGRLLFVLKSPPADCEGLEQVCAELQNFRAKLSRRDLKLTRAEKDQLSHAILGSLTQRPSRLGAGYSERLDLQLAEAVLQQTACKLLSYMGGRSVRIASPAIVEVLQTTVVAGCSAQCCNASWVARNQYRAKRVALSALAQCSLEALEQLSGALVEKLLAPPKKFLALPMAELLARAAGAASACSSQLVIAISHPCWQVAEAAVRALGRAQATPEICRTLEGATDHAEPRVVVAALRSVCRLGANEDRTKAILMRAIDHRSARVRWAALTLLRSAKVVRAPLDGVEVSAIRSVAEHDPDAAVGQLASRVVAAVGG